MECPICLAPLREDPTTLPCGHSLCMRCLAKLNEEKCAECRAPFNRSQQRPSIALRTLLLLETKPQERPSYFSWADLWHSPPPGEATPPGEARPCATTTSWRAYVRRNSVELNEKRDERTVARLCRLIHDEESDEDPTKWTERITGMHDDLILSGLYDGWARTAVVVATQVANRKGRFGDEELLCAVRSVMR